MTESEWLTCADPVPMLRLLESRWVAEPGGDIPASLRRNPGTRKVWLFCCACARRGEYLGEARVAGERRQGLDVTEQLLDGVIGHREWDIASVAGLDAHHDAASTVVAHLFYRWDSSFAAAIDAADTIAREYWTHPEENYEEYLAAFSIEEQAEKRTADKKQRLHLSGLMRCIFGNPFRPATIFPAWQTRTVVALAQAAYDSRNLPGGTLEPDRLAVLADALEDAGCTNSDILNHLRQAGEHVRGCWVIDLLCGK
jgi:hypothetical protein